MKTIAATALALSLLIGSLALANAPRLTFDDSGFDYAPNDQEQIAYVQLERDAGGLRLSFSSIPGASNLPTVTVKEVIETGIEGIFGNDVLASRDDLAEISVIARGKDAARLVTLHHEYANLSRTVDNYLRVVQELGYDVEPVLNYGATKVFTFSDGATEYRIVFAYAGKSVRVTIT